MAKKIPKEILRCPSCFSEKLTYNNETILCVACSKTYKSINNKFFFYTLASESIQDPLDKIKYFFKKYDKLYAFLISIVSPALPDLKLRKFLREHAEKENIICINLGSGNSDISPYVSNIDIFSYDNVDMTCDIKNLPLKNDCVDAVINTLVLEHISEPEKVVGEIHRVLKKGGLVYSVVPFIFNFHASPSDYQRWTSEGMRHLYRDFEILELSCPSGPTSGLLNILQVWIALVFSFGIKPLYIIIYLLVMCVTFPLKFLDIFLIHHPFAKNISALFRIIAKK